MANNTTLLEKWNGEPLNSFYNIFFLFLVLIVIITNGLVVWVSGRFLIQGPRKKRSTYIVLGNLSLTTILYTVWGIIYRFELYDEEASRNICSLIAVLNGASYMAYRYSVGLIAIDRYLFIMHGMYYERWVYPSRATLLIGGIWLIGLTKGTVPLFWWKQSRIQRCYPTILAPRTYVLLDVVILMLPTAIVVISYSIILWKALWKLKQMQPRNNEKIIGPRGGLRIHVGSATSMNNTDTSFNNEKKWKAIKRVLLTTSPLIVTWASYQIVWCIRSFSCSNEVKETNNFCLVYSTILKPIFLILILFYDLLAPIIYVWWQSGFKNVRPKWCILTNGTKL